MNSRPGPVTVVAFAAMVAIAGANFVAVRFSNVELPPFWGAAVRFAVASLLFFAIALARRTPWPDARGWAGAALYGVLGFGAFYALAYYALVHVTAGLAAVVLALAPLATLIVALAQGVERFRWQGLVGSLIAASGVAALFRQQLSAAVPPLALLALVIAAFMYAQASVIAKRLPKIDPFFMNAIGTAAGTLFLLALSEFRNEVHVIPTQAPTWTALVYLTTIGSVGLFFLFLFVLRRWTPTAASYQFVLNPIAAMAFGAALAGEAVTATFVASTALVVWGVYVGALWRPPPGATAPTPKGPATGPKAS